MDDLTNETETDAAVETPAPPIDTEPAEHPRVAELEEENAALRARVDELEADPYASDADLGDVTPGLLLFHEMSYIAEVQAWERETGLSFETGEPLARADTEEHA